MKKNILGPIIRSLRKERNITQQQLSQLTGFSQNSISNHENGNRKIDEADIKIYARAFGITPQEMFDRLNGVRDEPTFAEEIVRYKVGKDLVPIVGKIAAGTPNYALEDVIGYMSLPPNRKSSDGLVYLEVTSDSMDRKFPVGSYVLIDTEAQVENGDIAAVKINGEEATLKQVKFEEDDEVMLIPQSTNPNHFPVSLKIQQDEVAIIGKAVGVYSSI